MVTRRDFLKLISLGSVGMLAACSSPAAKGNAASADTASGDGTQPSTAGEAEASSSSGTTSATALVVDFSYEEHTWQMAQRIAEKTGADLFRIEPTTAYPDDYNTTVGQARQEQRANEMPDYTGDVDGWEGYDTIYLGYPIWWYQLPQIVKHFCSDHDWTGKHIYLFDSHMGSGWSDTPDEVRNLCGGATAVDEGVSIRGDEIPDRLDEVDSWLTDQGLA